MNTQPTVRGKPSVSGKEVAVSGRILKTAKLRHEWCDFIEVPVKAIAELKGRRPVADLFTFVGEIGDQPLAGPYLVESVSVAVLPIVSYKKWFENIGFKTRNKIRKAEKSGVEFRVAALDAKFARGVEEIYNESPIRQGRKFFHYGQTAAEIESELQSFADRSVLVGAYYQEELIGFMKLFYGRDVLRTIHIIAKMSHREKCAMDGLIAKAVELCDQKGLHHLHYGSWTDGGIGAFREKHGFERREVPRYSVLLTWRGRIIFRLKLHRPMRDRFPKRIVAATIGLRARWNSYRFRSVADTK